MSQLLAAWICALAQQHPARASGGTEELRVTGVRPRKAPRRRLPPSLRRRSAGEPAPRSLTLRRRTRHPGGGKAGRNRTTRRQTGPRLEGTRPRRATRLVLPLPAHAVRGNDAPQGSLPPSTPRRLGRATRHRTDGRQPVPLGETGSCATGAQATFYDAALRLQQRGSGRIPVTRFPHLCRTRVYAPSDVSGAAIKTVG